MSLRQEWDLTQDIPSQSALTVLRAPLRAKCRDESSSLDKDRITIILYDFSSIEDATNDKYGDGVGKAPPSTIPAQQV
jgi:hypothetical protein